MFKTQSFWSNVTIFSLAAALCCGLAITAVGQKRIQNWVADEVLVKFKPGKTKAIKNEVVGRLHLSIVQELGDLGWVRVKIGRGQTVDDAIRDLGRSIDVDSVQPNYYYRLQSVPNDALWTDLYGMVKISSPAAWDITTGDSSVVVADIDTGFDYTHEDLAANAWTNPGEIPNNGVDDDGNGFIDDYYGYDFRYNDPDPMDENGHGTHTAGTLGAVGNNMLGVAGVAWHVKIMGIKIYSPNADDSTSAMVINAYNYVRMMKNRGVNIRVTNNSYGGCPETCGDDFAVKDAIDALGDTGVLNVFAAGNAGTNNDISPFYPASFDSPSIISVGGSDQNDNCIFNYGATSVDISAPGSIIMSTTPMTNHPPYHNLSGTSMSTPHVTGAAALLAMYRPSLSAASIKATLINSADVLPQFAGLNRAGGRLNIRNGLRKPTVCSFGLSADSISVPTKGGAFSVDVATNRNCDYSVKSNENWVHITSQYGMTGNSTVTFRVNVNTTISRSGTISIGGRIFTVNQSRL